MREVDPLELEALQLERRRDRHARVRGRDGVQRDRRRHVVEPIYVKALCNPCEPSCLIRQCASERADTQFTAVHSTGSVPRELRPAAGDHRALRLGARRLRARRRRGRQARRGRADRLARERQAAVRRARQGRVARRRARAQRLPPRRRPPVQRLARLLRARERRAARPLQRRLHARAGRPDGPPGDGARRRPTRTRSTPSTRPRSCARARAMRPLLDWRGEKENAGRFSWTLGLYGTPAMAAEAEMGLEEYWEQIIHACFLDAEDPIARWREVGERVSRSREWLDALRDRARARRRARTSTCTSRSASSAAGSAGAGATSRASSCSRAPTGAAPRAGSTATSRSTATATSSRASAWSSPTGASSRRAPRRTSRC